MPELAEEIRSAMCRPEGTVDLEFQSDLAFKHEAPAGVLIDVVAGAHYFRLERTAGRSLRYFHASPGTGTRVAEIALGDLPDFSQAYLAFSWSPEEIALYCGPRIPDGQLMSAKGVKSDVQFRVGSDGHVYAVGGPGVDVLTYRFRQTGQPVLTTTALETWNSTLKAIEILWTGESTEGFAFEVVQANIALSMLVTGLEAYAKARLLEVEREGIRPNWERVFAVFASTAEKKSGRLSELEAESRASDSSLLEAVVSATRVNFQNYEHLKRVYRAAYDIKVADLGLKTATVAKLRRFIHHRHRVVHVSPLLGILNEERVPPEKPVFANRATSDGAVVCFGVYVQALHAATHRLRPEQPECSPTSTSSRQAPQA